MIEAAEQNCTYFKWIKRSILRGVLTQKSWKKTIIFIIICFVIFKLLKSSKTKKHDVVVKSNHEKELRYLDIPLKSKVIVDSPEISPLSNEKLSLDDITITIKSTGRYHAERVSLLLDTWVKKAINQVQNENFSISCWYVDDVVAKFNVCIISFTIEKFHVNCQVYTIFWHRFFRNR